DALLRLVGLQLSDELQPPVERVQQLAIDRRYPVAQPLDVLVARRTVHGLSLPRAHRAVTRLLTTLTRVTTAPAQPWSPSSWRGLPARHQPTWPDDAASESARRRLAAFPPLVFAGEARALREALAHVAEGRA